MIDRLFEYSCQLVFIKYLEKEERMEKTRTILSFLEEY